jgi:hypothetical protein
LQAPPIPGDLTPSQRQEHAMAWRTPTDAEIAAVIDAACRREVVA